MKFIYKNQMPGEHRIFDGKTASDGDVVEYDGFFMQKAITDKAHFEPWAEAKETQGDMPRSARKKVKVSGN